MKGCPVCGKVGLADDAPECPQCGADLECFDLLGSLHEEVVAPQQAESGPTWTKELAETRASPNGIRETLGRRQKSGWMRSYGMSALFVVVLGALILFLYRDLASGRRFDDRVSRLELRTRSVGAALKAKERSELIAKMEAITRRLGAMENTLSTVSAAQEATGGRLTATLEDLNRISERLSDLTAAPSPSAEEAAVPAGSAGEAMFLYHEPRKGETLWSIAKRYYGKGGFYPVLLEHNPGLGIYFDPGYGGLRVLKDRQRAKEVFAALMSARGNRTLFRYRVVEGDTWEHVSRRLFGHASKATELATLNPSIGLVAGERVFVPLP